MGAKTPETCSAVNKLQDNKLKNCCIWLVIYLNCTMMHAFKKPKIYKITLRDLVHVSGSSTPLKPKLAPGQDSGPLPSTFSTFRPVPPV